MPSAPSRLGTWLLLLAGCDLAREGTGTAVADTEAEDVALDGAAEDSAVGETLPIDATDTAASDTFEVSADTSGDGDAADTSLPKPDTLGGLVVWLEPSSIEVDGSLKVTRWRDVSGAGNDYIQPDGARRPSSLSAPAVQFGAGYLEGPELAKLIKTGFTLFIVLRLGAGKLDTAGCYMTDGIFADRGAYLGLGVRASTGVCGFAYNSVYQDTPPLAVTPGVLKSVMLRWNGTALDVAVDGAVQTAPSAIGVLTNATLLGRGYGDAQWGTFSAHEMVVYNRGLTEPEVAVVNAYLQARFKL